MSNFARPAPNWQHRPTTLFMLARYADRDQIVVDTTYQRPFGYWDADDRVALFDTIFEGGDIGKMVFADLGWRGNSKEKLLEIISRMNELRSSDQVILTAITSFSEVEPIPQDTLLYYYARRKGLELRRIVGCYVGRYAGGYTEGLRVLVPKGWPTISLYYAFDHSDSYYPVIISSGLATISDQWDVTFPVSSESDLHLAINEIEEYLTEYGAMFAFDLGGIYTPRGVI